MQIKSFFQVFKKTIEVGYHVRSIEKKKKRNCPYTFGHRNIATVGRDIMTHII